MKRLVADQLPHQLLVALRHATGNEPVQHVCHLFFHKSPAFQQNFTQSQHLAVGQLHLVDLLHPVTFASPVVSDGIDIPCILRVQLQEISDIIDIPLDASIVYLVSLSFFRLVDCLPVKEFCVNPQHPLHFAVSEILHPHPPCPIVSNIVIMIEFALHFL